MSKQPANLTLVMSALAFASGSSREADLRDIYREAEQLYPEWRDAYKSQDSFHATIRHTLERYCPQSENFSLERPAMFEKTGTGRYRVLVPTERDASLARGRRL